MDGRLSTPNGKLAECSLLEDDPARTVRDYSVDCGAERAYFLEKISGLYEKLEGTLQECIHLKKENESLKARLQSAKEQSSPSEPLPGECKQKAMFEMLL